MDYSMADFVTLFYNCTKIIQNTRTCDPGILEHIQKVEFKRISEIGDNKRDSVSKEIREYDSRVTGNINKDSFSTINDYIVVENPEEENTVDPDFLLIQGHYHKRFLKALKQIDKELQEEIEKNPPILEDDNPELDEMYLEANYLSDVDDDDYSYLDVDEIPYNYKKRSSSVSPKRTSVKPIRKSKESPRRSSIKPIKKQKSEKNIESPMKNENNEEPKIEEPIPVKEEVKEEPKVEEPKVEKVKIEEQEVEKVKIEESKEEFQDSFEQSQETEKPYNERVSVLVEQPTVDTTFSTTDDFPEETPNKTEISAISELLTPIDKDELTKRIEEIDKKIIDVLI